MTKQMLGRLLRFMLVGGVATGLQYVILIALVVELQVIF